MANHARGSTPTRVPQSARRPWMAEEQAQATPSTTFTTRTTCRACFSTAITSVLDLGHQILPRFAESKEGLPSAPLHLCRCANCGLLQLRDTVNPDLLFREFWYRSGINQTM